MKLRNTSRRPVTVKGVTIPPGQVREVPRMAIAELMDARYCLRTKLKIERIEQKKTATKEKKADKEDKPGGFEGYKEKGDKE